MPQSLHKERKKAIYWESGPFFILSSNANTICLDKSLIEKNFGLSSSVPQDTEENQILLFFFFLIPVEAIKKHTRQWNNGLSHCEWVNSFHITLNICKDGLQRGGRLDLMLLPVWNWPVCPEECKVAVHTAFFLVIWLGRKKGICPLLSVAPLVGFLP